MRRFALWLGLGDDAEKGLWKKREGGEIDISCSMRSSLSLLSTSFLSLTSLISPFPPPFLLLFFLLFFSSTLRSVGKTKDRLPVYATTVRPDLAKRLGFKGAKIPLPFSHIEGVEGLKKNVETIRKARESVGPDFPLMIDCYMSLTVRESEERSEK